MAIVFWTHRTYAGFGYWLVGTCFRTLAALPFLLPRDQYPPWLTIVLPNYMMLAELLFYLRGTLIFRGRTVRIGWEFAASLSSIALIA